MRNAPPSAAPLLLLPLWAWLLLAPAPAGAEEPGAPFLVRDIEPSGRPIDLEADPPRSAWGSLIEQLNPFDDRLVFVAFTFEQGFEPWVSDGTAEGTRPLGDICPGPCDSSPRLVGQLGERFYFFALDPVAGTRLWATDGTPAGTRRLDELCPPLCDVALPYAYEGEWRRLSWKGHLYFTRYEPGHPGRIWLWTTDGTPAGTRRVRKVCGSEGCPSSFASIELAVAGENLFVRTGNELWRLAGPEAMPKRIWQEPSPSFLQRELTPLGDRLLFRNRTELWSVGAPGAEPELVWSGAHFGAWGLTAGPGSAYFTTWAEPAPQVRGASEIWRTDGTATGTVLLASLPRNELRTIEALVLVGEHLLFNESPGSDWDWRNPTPLLFRLDPAAGPEPLAAPARRPPRLVPIGDRLYFAGHSLEGTLDQGGELWASDGTSEGTRVLQDIWPGPGSSWPGFNDSLHYLLPPFVAAGGLLYFPATDPDHDTELWALELPEEPEEPQEPEPPPPPPSDEWLETPELPGFRFQVELSAPGGVRAGVAEAACIPETLCVSGALPGRSELFVRIVGPKPNGFLWPTLVKFTTSTVDVWIEQVGSGEVRHYRLEGASPEGSELPGLFDREGFTP